MKDVSKDFLESERPNVSGIEAIQHSLDMLFDDDDKSVNDEVVKNLTYEELIGALLLARDEYD